MRNKFIIYSFLIFSGIFGLGYYWSDIYWSLFIVIPLFLCGLYDLFQTKHTIWRNFPLVGRGRMLMEALRPPMYQYFVESETAGSPINRMFRSVVYQRAKRVLDTVPFGTKVDVYRVGYEWMDHSLGALHSKEMNHDMKIKVGGPDCLKPYHSELLNISAMSFGALSNNAILALNGGAKSGGFAHNTGEGSISPYHLEKGGDLTWQVGTGYFGCRTEDGKFSEELFKKNAAQESVKMIEIKLSQGAKPGHGGILPSDKNTPEIAKIRGVRPYTRIDSPPTHSAFSTPLEFVAFIKKLRDLSGGKPIGFKICIGRKSEFLSICKAMVEKGIKPDFITVDGGEGGTGAAPLEYANSVGMPLADSLPFVVDCLMGYDLKKDIKIIASGKIITGFHIIKNLALGADLCNSARGMMLALGCIQALECNNNKCPTGVATQNPELTNGLVVSDKENRVANYHSETIKSVMELLAASGLNNSEKLNRSHLHRRVSRTEVLRYDEIYPYVKTGDFLNNKYPAKLKKEFEEASSESFIPKKCVVCMGEN